MELELKILLFVGLAPAVGPVQATFTIEPYSDRKETAIRFHVEGIDSNYMRIPVMSRRALVSRIKILSDLDTSERWKPQDEKIRFKLNQD